MWGVAGVGAAHAHGPCSLLPPVAIFPTPPPRGQCLSPCGVGMASRSGGRWIRRWIGRPVGRWFGRLVVGRASARTAARARACPLEARDSIVAQAASRQVCSWRLTRGWVDVAVVALVVLDSNTAQVRSPFRTSLALLLGERREPASVSCAWHMASHRIELLRLGGSPSRPAGVSAPRRTGARRAAVGSVVATKRHSQVQSRQGSAGPLRYVYSCHVQHVVV